MSDSSPLSFFVVDEPEAVSSAITDALAACGFALERGDLAGATAIARSATPPAAFVVPWAVGQPRLAALVHEANATPVVTAASDSSIFAAAFRIGCAAVWSLPLSANFPEAAARVAKRGAAVVRLLRLVQDFNALADDYLKRLVAVEHELYDVRGANAEPDDAIALAKRILVVDDEPVIVALLTETLSDAGFEVDGAASAEEAATRFGAKPAAVVLTDKNLPGKSGIDLLRDLRARAPQTAVLLMTGYASIASAVEAINLGAVGYITKPFGSLEEVTKQVSEAADGVARKLKAGRVFRVFMERNRALVDRMRALAAERGGTGESKK